MRKKNIEKQIAKIADYFKNKLLAGDFEYISQDDWSVKLRIDNFFEVQVWTSNGIPYFGLYDIVIRNGYKSKFRLTLENGPYSQFKTEKQRLQAWSNIEPFINK